MEFERLFSNLNLDLLNLSQNNYDIRTFNGVIRKTNVVWGITEIINNINFQDDSNFKNFIPDSTRELYKELLELLKNNPEALSKAEELLKREILYLGADCDELGKIDVEEEYKRLNGLLKSKYLYLEKVESPTYSCLMDTWDKLKPKIIFISCHGTRFGLILKDESGKCKEYTISDLIEFFDKRSEYTECVVLSACESLDLGKAISEYGKNVVCINKKVEITSATKYTNEFFKYINNHSLENSSVYKNAHDFSLEKIQIEGLNDSFSFEFIKQKKITL